MAKYLFKAKYVGGAGVKGLIEDGGSERHRAVEALCASLGGKLESFYYAFGDVDVYAIVDLPDTVSAVAASVTVSASGLATVEVVPLILPEEIDAAVKKSPLYDAPGKD